MSLRSFYIRSYALLLMLTLLVALVGYLLVSGLNRVRERAWQEHFPVPLLSWLRDNPDGVHVANWVSDNVDIQYSSTADLELTPVERERLSYGQVISRNRGSVAHLLLKTSGNGVLDASFDHLYQDVSRVSALIAAWELEQISPVQRHQVLDELGGQLGIGIRYVASSEEVPGEVVLDQLASNGFAYDQQAPDDAAKIYVRLNDGEVVRMSMAAPFDLWPWPMLLIMLLLIAGALAVANYYVLARLHQRLRGIENVVGRIARGELDARVKVDNVSIVDRLSEAFNSMAEHIQRLVQVQQEMIHAVSHELRTPVARIRFGVQMIEDCTDEATLHKQLVGIDSDIQELDELIDEILTYARLEQGGPILATQTVNLQEVVEQVVREQQMTRPNLNIHAVVDLTSDDWKYVDVEPRYIHRAIQNLVGNATRYAAGEVRVHCHFGEETCRVDVEDDGPGIPEEDWERVFTPFARLDDSRTRKSGGYGLGLSIVRRILYWHGGQAFVSRSEDLGGARFSLVWPRSQSE
ncbi:ATP-binding protein [Mangrovitalea sediminis]|uniref:ATP-binding protein n=1 Tax=Mangrovitalea sediminis TaxID=1982043 RepID=UPI000BE5B3BF|nr:ATP-binding protein [Mangrovitalea sediminis]